MASEIDAFGTINDFLKSINDARKPCFWYSQKKGCRKGKRCPNRHDVGHEKERNLDRIPYISRWRDANDCDHITLRPPIVIQQLRDSTVLVRVCRQVEVDAALAEKISSEARISGGSESQTVPSHLLEIVFGATADAFSC